MNRILHRLENEESGDDDDVDVEVLLEENGIAFVPARTIPTEAAKIPKSPPSAEKRRQARASISQRHWRY